MPTAAWLSRRLNIRSNQNPYDILRHIAAFKADVIGFSCYIWNIEMTCHIISLVKDVFPKTKVFVGGPEVSYTARKVLEDCPQITTSFKGKGKSWCRTF